MPHTAATFLIGATAIVGLPPLNGFVSEWLVFLSLLETGATTVPIRLGVIAAAGLGLIGALALACFAKVVGIVFLGSPRTPLAGAAHESPRGMLGPLFVLAGACILIGLLPIFGVGAALRAGIVVVGSGSEMIGRSANAAAAQLTIFSLATAVALMFVWLVRSWIWPRRDAASTETWACGYASPTARMQYTSSSFAAPLLAAWSGVSGIRKHRTPVSFSTHALEPVLDGVLRPAWRVLRASAAWFHPIQRGRLSHYLLYIGVAVVSLLLYLLAAGGAS
jgi:NADH:ubiquinone oxidoreductase subunit 5 (subunit L)/multisubunit Na+/H+ antiporter MnhA subunit